MAVAAAGRLLLMPLPVMNGRRDFFMAIVKGGRQNDNFFIFLVKPPIFAAAMR